VSDLAVVEAVSHAAEQAVLSKAATILLILSIAHVIWTKVVALVACMWDSFEDAVLRLIAFRRVVRGKLGPTSIKPKAKQIR
jgi:hypothetical protein